MAEDRFKSLLQRFARDSKFEEDNRTAMKKYLDQDYASRLVGPAANEAKYFLSYHEVYKGLKLRVFSVKTCLLNGKV